MSAAARGTQRGAAGKRTGNSADYAANRTQCQAKAGPNGRTGDVDHGTENITAGLAALTR